MFRNAGITSKIEAAQRLIGGEVFFYEGRKIKFNQHAISPFRIDDDALSGVWHEFPKWEIEVDWRDNIGGGVWCICYGTILGIPGIPCLVTSYNKGHEYPYESFGNRFLKAEPMTREEVLKFVKD